MLSEQGNVQCVGMSLKFSDGGWEVSEKDNGDVI